MLKPLYKIIFVFFLLLFSCFNCFSQNSDIIIHSKRGLKFNVYVNDNIFKNKYDTLIKINDIEPKITKFKIVFENKNNSDIIQNINIKPEKIYYYNIYPQNKNNKVISMFLKKEFILKQMSVNSKNLNIDSTKNDKNNESVIITTTNNSGDYVTHYILPNYTGNIGCPWPITLIEFNTKLKQISADSSDEGKLLIAKDVFAKSCLFTDEVKSVALLLNDETLRFDFVKYTFKRTFDIGNYYLIQDIFQTEMIINEFNSYIKNTRY